MTTFVKDYYSAHSQELVPRIKLTSLKLPSTFDFDSLYDNSIYNIIKCYKTQAD